MLNGLDLINNYPEDIDIEMIPLLNKINSINGFRTVWSCDGGNCEYPYIIFKTKYKPEWLLNIFCDMAIKDSNRLISFRDYTLKTDLIFKPFNCEFDDNCKINEWAFSVEFMAGNGFDMDVKSRFFIKFLNYIEKQIKKGNTNVF